MGKTIIVSPYGDEWKVKQPNNKKASYITDTQAEAKDVARRIAKNQGLERIVLGVNGKIVEKNSYGHDPRSVKG